MRREEKTKRNIYIYIYMYVIEKLKEKRVSKRTISENVKDAENEKKC